MAIICGKKKISIAIYQIASTLTAQTHAYVVIDCLIVLIEYIFINEDFNNCYDHDHNYTKLS